MTNDEISLREYFEARWKAHEGVHEMGQRAIDAALITLNIRLESMNEFRAQILKERGEFLKQQVYDIEHAALEKRVSDHGKWIDNMNGRLWGLGVFILVINIAVGLLLKFWGK